MLGRQQGGLESMKSNYTSHPMCNVPLVTVRRKSRRDDYRNLDPISERRVDYKQSLLNQAGSVRVGQKLPAERAFLEVGIHWS